MFGRPILVNNAGCDMLLAMMRKKMGPVRRQPEERLQLQQAAAVMRQKYGRIVNIASVASIASNRDRQFAASKAGVNSPSRWRKRSARATSRNAVAPGRRYATDERLAHRSEEAAPAAPLGRWDPPKR
jgi:NAD(P)-dependent dehydrogenase (short-subunit alcohol dehydrogenase family)